MAAGTAQTCQFTVIPGTTPTHRFTIPVEKGDIQRVRVTYGQGYKLLLTKEDGDCQVEGDVLAVKLAQEDTLLFDDSSLIQIQVRVLTTGGDAFASDLIRVPCGVALDREVLE